MECLRNKYVKGVRSLKISGNRDDEGREVGLGFVVVLIC